MTRYFHCKNNDSVRAALVHEAKTFEPDLIHLQIQHTTVIDGETISKIKSLLPKTIISNWTGDVRDHVPITYKNIAQASDYNFISSTGQLDMFRQVIGKDIRYWQIGYNSELYSPATEEVENKYDAIFIASYNDRENYPGTVERVDTCRVLKTVFGNRFALFGSGWPRHIIVPNGSLEQRIISRFYHQSICAISVSHFNNIDHYFSDRLLMCMASGRPTISLKFPKYEDYFTHMSDLIIVDSVKDIPNAVNMLKNDSGLADFIGKSGAAKVFAEHTYYSRIKELLNMLGFL
jgi:spore maturation protein CgeB